MARANLNQTAFTGGVLSPRVLGRVDIDRYQIGLKRCSNAHPVLHGGVKRRAGSRYLGAADSAVANGSKLVPFFVSQDEAWMLEFSDASVRIWNADGTALGITLTSPYAGENLRRLDWAQSDSTLYLFSPFSPIYRLQRFSDTAWTLGPANFTTAPFSEIGHRVAVFGTLSATAVGAATLSTGAPAFVLADVGRAVVSGQGIAVITAFISDSLVSVDITRAFTSASLSVNQWLIDSSPQATCTPSAETPVGLSITLTLGAAGWRTTDVGAVVRINGGLCKITAYTSPTIVSATILREMVGTTAAPALAWSINYNVWNGIDGYPRTGTIHQQRLVAASNERFPRTVWGSRVGEPLDFELGTTDDLAFAFTVDGDEASPILYVSSVKDLVVMTGGGEYSMRSGIESGLTPTNVRVVPESGHGSAPVRPTTAGDEMLAVQRSGRKLRSLAYRYDFDGYSAPDILALAEHLGLEGITGLAWQSEPEQILWAVRGDGKLLSCTLDRGQQPSVIAWAGPHDVGGFVEDVQTLPEGDRDWVWLIVRRVVGGSTVRYIERLDETLERLHPTVSDGVVYGCTVDSGVVFDNAAGQTSVSLPHLAGLEVDIVADGLKQPRQTVGAGGALTLARSTKRAIVGLPFRSEITLLNAEFQTGAGTAQGQATRTSKVWLRFLDTIGARVTSLKGANVPVPFKRFGAAALDTAPTPYTGLVDVTLLGWTDIDDQEISIVQEDPLPLHLLAVIRRHGVNGG
jgi:hypothetical protein